LHEAYWVVGNCGLELEFAVDTIPFYLSISLDGFLRESSSSSPSVFFPVRISVSFFGLWERGACAEVILEVA
jgi:hypothetical protein